MKIVNNFLEKSIFYDILRSYPTIDFFKQYGHPWGNSRYNLALQSFDDLPYKNIILKKPEWKKFFDKINCIDFKNFLYEIFKKDLTKYCNLDLMHTEFSLEPYHQKLYFVIDIAIASNDYFLDSHVDSRDKIIAGMFYLNNINCTGGDLTLNNVIIKPEKNKAVFWINHNNSFHGVDLIKNINGYRKFIYIALMYGDAEKNIWKN